MRFFWLFSVMLWVACERFEPSAPNNSSTLDGPVSGLSEDQHLQFLRGDAAFNDQVFNAVNGLGPLFVATSCGSCHAGDGKGHPFTTLTRFGQADETGNLFLNQGGPQLQNRAIPGYAPEQIPPGTTFANFTPPANTGLGFLDAVTDVDILAYADPTDADGDGISGTPNWVDLKTYVSARDNSVTQNGKYIGRFGKKGSTYNLLQQTAQAYNQDIGITSTFQPMDTYSGKVMDPEVSNKTVEDVVFYLKTLKVPEPRPQDDGQLGGKQLFASIGCDKCHRAEMKTADSPIQAIANKTFFPYSDLLLHDMGSGLDDGYTEGSAKTFEWRTPPLWGLGLSKNSQGGQYFLLHDGRARSIGEAILFHGGESSKSKENFESLTEADKDKVIRFLESL